MTDKSIGHQDPNTKKPAAPILCTRSLAAARRLIQSRNPNSTEVRRFRPIFFMMRLAFPRAGTSEKRRDARAGCH